VYFSILQCIVVCCCPLTSKLRQQVKCVAVCCSAMLCVAVCCSVLQCVAERCSALQCVVVSCPLASKHRPQFGVSFNLNLQSLCHRSLFNGTWQKRPGELDHDMRPLVSKRRPQVWYDVMRCRVLCCCAVRCMGWLRLVGSLNLHVPLGNIGLFCRALLQKRPVFLRSLILVATP